MKGVVTLEAKTCGYNPVKKLLHRFTTPEASPKASKTSNPTSTQGSMSKVGTLLGYRKSADGAVYLEVDATDNGLLLGNVNKKGVLELSGVVDQASYVEQRQPLASGWPVEKRLRGSHGTCKGHLQEGKATRRPRGRKSKPSPKEAEETPGSVATVVRTEQAEPVTLDSIKLLLKEMMKENMPKSSPSVPPVSDTNKDLSKEQPKQSNLLLQAEVAKLRQSISEAQPVLAKVLRVTQSGNNLVSGSNEMQVATTNSKQQRQQLLEELASPQPHSSSNILQYHLMVEQQMLQQQQYYNQQLLEHQHKQARVQLLKQLLF
eukprot:g41018.t1